jgi:hypothetical protein
MIKYDHAYFASVQYQKRSFQIDDPSQFAIAGSGTRVQELMVGLELAYR